MADLTVRGFQTDGSNPNLDKVDPRLLASLQAGAQHLPRGYQVVVTEGYTPTGHASASQHHVAGSGAVDVYIKTPGGSLIPRTGNDTTGLYTTLARATYGEALARYPELKGQIAWGGAFPASGKNAAADLMHFDLGGERGRYTNNRLSSLGALPDVQYGSSADAIAQNFPTDRMPLPSGLTSYADMPMPRLRPELTPNVINASYTRSLDPRADDGGLQPNPIPTPPASVPNVDVPLPNLRSAIPTAPKSIAPAETLVKAALTGDAAAVKKASNQLIAVAMFGGQQAQDEISAYFAKVGTDTPYAGVIADRLQAEPELAAALPSLAGFNEKITSALAAAPPQKWPTDLNPSSDKLLNPSGAIDLPDVAPAQPLTRNQTADAARYTGLANAYQAPKIATTSAPVATTTPQSRILTEAPQSDTTYSGPKPIYVAPKTVAQPKTITQQSFNDRFEATQPDQQTQQAAATTTQPLTKAQTADAARYAGLASYYGAQTAPATVAPVQADKIGTALPRLGVVRQPAAVTVAPKQASTMLGGLGAVNASPRPTASSSSSIPSFGFNNPVVATQQAHNTPSGVNGLTNSQTSGGDNILHYQMNGNDVTVVTDRNGMSYTNVKPVSSGSSSSSSAASSSTVLCTYFMRKGWLAKDLWKADARFSRQTFSRATVNGYHFWAVPAVLSMQRGNRVLEMILWPVVKHWAAEIGYQMGVRPKGSLIGKTVRLVLEPMSWIIGQFASATNWRVTA